MNKQDLEYLCQKLRNGEYEGKDIMQAWIAIEKLQSDKEELIITTTNFLNDISDQELEIDVWDVITRIN